MQVPALVLVGFVLYCLIGYATAAVCAVTGEPRPSVVTVIASKQFPDSDAWIVKPDCSIEVVSFGGAGASDGIDIPSGRNTLVMRSKGIERVESLPSRVVGVNLGDNPLSKGADFTSAIVLATVTIGPSSINDIKFPDTVKILEITKGSFPALSIKLPPHLVELTISDTSIKSLKGLDFPATLQTIDVSRNQLDSLEGITFPTEMHTLKLNDNQLTTLAGVTFPTKLVALKLNKNKLTTLGCMFPKTVEQLDLSSNQLTTLSGAKFPISAKTLTFNDNKLTTLDVELPADLNTLQAEYNQLSSLKGLDLPERLNSLELRYNVLKAIDSPLPRFLEYLYLTGNQISSIRGVWLPPLLNTLNLEYNKLKTIGTTLPRRIKTLFLDGNRISSLKGVSLPPELVYLSIAGNKLVAFDTFVPVTLQTLVLWNNPLHTLELVTISDDMEYINVEGTNLTTVRGVRWPAGYNFVRLSGCRESCGAMSFEIRQSDLASFVAHGTLDEINFVQTECSNPEAERVPVGRSNNVCVISDELFDELYPPIEEIVVDESFEPPAEGDSSTDPPEDPDPPEETDPPQATQPPQQSTPSLEPELPPHTQTHSPSSSGSSSGSGSGSVGDDIDVTSLVTVPKSTKATASRKSTSQPEPTEKDDSNASAGDDDSGNGARAGKKNAKTNKSPSALNSNSTRVAEGSDADSPSTDAPAIASLRSTSMLPIAVASISAAFVLLVCVCVYRLMVARRRKKAATGDGSQYSTLESPNTGLSTEPPVISFLTNDIRNDERLVAFRLDESHVILGNEIARSGTGVVYRGVFQGREVIVKQVVGTATADETALARFMNEIRMCASLDHAKITAFVGFAWKGHNTLSAVTEFMPGGDLSTLLVKQDEVASADAWKTPWAVDNIQVKSKISIALDVAEAVVYLHSLQTPVIHRDLKARNVLLDKQGNAKVSGFGISRETSFDETMTREVGSAAWMAPELLRGERYDEKADIYSLGVLLVELDRGCHPYANEAPLSTGEPGSNIVMANMEMARLVSEGQLRPSVSDACPDQVASLVAKCLSFDAEMRPTAMEVSHAIRQIRKAFTQNE